ncbi:hypothetical protein V8B97DRAFT_972383 [Scleroderma yunnanense]
MTSLAYRLSPAIYQLHAVFFEIARLEWKIEWRRVYCTAAHGVQGRWKHRLPANYDLTALLLHVITPSCLRPRILIVVADYNVIASDIIRFRFSLPCHPYYPLKSMIQVFSRIVDRLIQSGRKASSGVPFMKKRFICRHIHPLDGPRSSLPYGPTGLCGVNQLTQCRNLRKYKEYVYLSYNYILGKWYFSTTEPVAPYTGIS